VLPSFSIRGEGGPGLPYLRMGAEEPSTNMILCYRPEITPEEETHWISGARRNRCQDSHLQRASTQGIWCVRSSNHLGRKGYIRYLAQKYPRSRLRLARTGA